MPLPLLGWRVRLIWITAAALLLVLGIARPLGVMLIIAGVCFFLAVRCLMLERQFKEEAQKQDGAAEEELEI